MAHPFEATRGDIYTIFKIEKVSDLDDLCRFTAGSVIKKSTIHPDIFTLHWRNIDDSGQKVSIGDYVVFSPLWSMRVYTAEQFSKSFRKV